MRTLLFVDTAWKLTASAVVIASLPVSLTIVGSSVSARAAGAGETPVSIKECLCRNGLAYGPFRDGEGPGELPFPTVQQIDEDLGFISKVTKNVRIYGSSGKYADIPGLAKRHGLGVMLGIYLGNDPEVNKKEIKAAVALAHDQLTLPNGGGRVRLVDSIVVGNETLSDSSSQTSTGAQTAASQEAKKKLISYLREVKEQVAGLKIPVSTAQVAAVWESNLDLADPKNVDFVVAHFYPFWDQNPDSVENAAAIVLQRYKTLKSDLRAKYGQDVRVVIGETGWPSGGGRKGKAIPSPENQREVLEEFMKLACENSIEFYYFEAFDEEWKWNEGGDEEWTQLQHRPRTRGSQLPDDRSFTGKWIGSSWGIFQSSGKLKSKLADLFDQPEVGSRADRDIFHSDLGLLGYYDMGVDSWPDHRHDWVSEDGGELKMSYPNGQHAGSVFITVGEPTQKPRPWKNFSEFGSLTMELKGDVSGKTVEIGIKNRDGPENDAERRVVKTLTADYCTYKIPLRSLASGYLAVPKGLEKLNVVVEFVFAGPMARTVYARNIRYEPAE